MPHRKRKAKEQTFFSLQAGRLYTLSSCTHLSGLQACTRRRCGASSLPGTCDTPGEWHQQLGELTPAITPGLHRHPCIHCHPWPTPSPLEETTLLGGRLGAYRRMAFANSAASSLSLHAVRSSARDRVGEAASGHS